MRHRNPFGPWHPLLEIDSKANMIKKKCREKHDNKQKEQSKTNGEREKMDYLQLQYNTTCGVKANHHVSPYRRCSEERGETLPYLRPQTLCLVLVECVRRELHPRKEFDFYALSELENLRKGGHLRKLHYVDHERYNISTFRRD